MRIFLAAALDAEVSTVLEQSCRQLAQSAAAAQWRWSAVANYHLTLVFLGEIPASGLAAVERAAGGAAADCSQFQCRIANIAAFPGSDQPKCLVAEVEPCEPLLRLRRQLVAQLQREGIALQAHHYRPHITLARGNRHHRRAGSQSGMYPVIDRNLSVNAVTIYQSSKPPQAANYLPLASFALAAA